MSSAGVCRWQDLEASLGVAATLLPAYEAMFGVAYPLAKLDLVAIPNFAAGGRDPPPPKHPNTHTNDGLCRHCRGLQCEGLNLVQTSLTMRVSGGAGMHLSVVPWECVADMCVFDLA